LLMIVKVNLAYLYRHHEIVTGNKKAPTSCGIAYIRSLWPSISRWNNRLHSSSCTLKYSLVLPKQLSANEFAGGVI